MIDQQNTFSDAQPITATAISSVIDMGAPANDVNGNPAPKDPGQSQLYIEARVVEDFATLTSLQVQVEQSANANGSSPTVLLSTAAIGVATLKKGYKFILGSLPAGMSARYALLNYVVAGSNATTGKITAYLTPHPHSV